MSRPHMAQLPRWQGRSSTIPQANPPSSTLPSLKAHLSFPHNVRSSQRRCKERGSLYEMAPREQAGQRLVAGSGMSLSSQSVRNGLCGTFLKRSIPKQDSTCAQIYLVHDDPLTGRGQRELVAPGDGYARRMRRRHWSAVQSILESLRDQST